MCCQLLDDTKTGTQGVYCPTGMLTPCQLIRLKINVDPPHNVILVNHVVKMYLFVDCSICMHFVTDSPKGSVQSD